MLRFVVVTAAVSLLAAMSAESATAAGSWSIEPTPIPAGSRGSNLNGVSCARTNACTAVGEYGSSNGIGLTLAERWDGSVWQIQPTPNPTGAQSSTLFGASCHNARRCTAVGAYEPTVSDVPTLTLAERLTKRGWALQPTPNPPDTSHSFLFAVSCPARHVCTAVGSAFSVANEDRTLVERWDGRGWQIQPSPNPTGALRAFLRGVSCTSANHCVATGVYIDSNGILVTLAERWDGRSWQIQPTPNPAGATNTALVAVSCKNPSGCTAVGDQVSDQGGERSLAERWNGTSWQIRSVPDPAGLTTQSFLSGVSCPAVDDCTATGGYSSGPNGGNLTLAEHWDGRSWQVEPTPNPADAPVSTLDGGVSCATRDSCTAVGRYFTSNFIQFPLAEGFSSTP